MSAIATDLHPRVAAAMATVASDISVPSRGVGSDAVKDVPFTHSLEDGLVGGNTNFITDLYIAPENRRAVDNFYGNEAITRWAKGIDTDGAQLKELLRYFIQDYFYLVDYIKFKALRAISVPFNQYDTFIREIQSTAEASRWVSAQLKNIETIGRHIDKLENTNEYSDPAALVANSDRSIAELAYANFLQNSVERGDWFDGHVVTIPCVWGWSDLAIRLLEKEDTARTGIFYDLWLAPNVNFANQKPEYNGSAIELYKFLSANADSYTSINKTADVQQWNVLFRTTMRCETALFLSGKETQDTDGQTTRCST